MAEESRKARAHAAQVNGIAKDLVRVALSRAIDTTGGPGGKVGYYELVRAIHELGRRYERRAMAKKGANARKSKQPSLTPQLKRLRAYSIVLARNPQIMRHPHAGQHLSVLQKACVNEGIREPSLSTIRKDLEKLKQDVAKWAGQPPQKPGQRHVKVPAK